jgi:signal transduction histidine kinase/PAS domain-containing protein
MPSGAHSRSETLAHAADRPAEGILRTYDAPTRDGEAARGAPTWFRESVAGPSARQPLHFATPADADVTGALDFLTGGGAIGALIREEDWAATSLGPAERWPRSLQNALRLLLAAPYPMAIAWGPELVQFHNDAYARLVGATDQPRALGLSARELIADLRPVMGPRIDETIRRGESSVVEDHLICLFRNGYAEETYLTFRFDPISDDAAGVGGVLITLTDTTDRVINRRRTAALHRLASAAAGAHSVEAACQSALAEIARHPTDMAFALLYVRDAGGGQAHLAATAGLSPGGLASPEVIELGAEAAGWPVEAALTRNHPVTLTDLPARFGTLPAGDWPLAPRCALLMPLTPPGCDHPEAVLVVGVSARRALDVEYRRFIELVARQVTAAIAGGRAYEEQERHARAAAAAAKVARARRRARERALEARFAGVLEERTRMAREIHDTVLQGFTGITLQLQAVVRDLTREPERAKASVQRILAMADKTLVDARQAVWDMRAPALRAKSLAQALQDIARRAADGASPDVRFRLTGTPRPLEPAVEMALFRIAQEAVANALKHATASTIDVELVYERRATRLVVRDDGRGFDPADASTARGAHWGLVGMRERADHIGAHVTVTSADRRGTEVTVVVRQR